METEITSSEEKILAVRSAIPEKWRGGFADQLNTECICSLPPDVSLLPGKLWLIGQGFYKVSDTDI